MPLAAIALLAAVTFAFRLAGPVLGRRVTIPDSAQELLASAAAVLLLAVAATSALTQGHAISGEHGAGWARPAGVTVAGILAARRAPFPVVVVTAAVVTALLRLAGIALSGYRTPHGPSWPLSERPCRPAVQRAIRG
jgi:branched-subunit amino acid transport protein